MQHRPSYAFVVGAAALLSCVLFVCACRDVGDGTNKPRGVRLRSAGSSASENDASVAGNASPVADGGGGQSGSSQGHAGHAGNAGQAGTASTNDDDAGASIPDTSSHDAGTPTISHTCGLDVNTTTIGSAGTYTPNNIGALWVETASGTFVKTLALWADRRIEQLHGWIDSSTAVGLPENTVDAITSATADVEGPHTGHWDCNDTTDKRRPDGDYRICFELTESDKAGPLDCVSFSKTASPLQLMPPDTKVFTQRSIVFTP